MQKFIRKKQVGSKFGKENVGMEVMYDRCNKDEWVRVYYQC